MVRNWGGCAVLEGRTCVQKEQKASRMNRHKGAKAEDRVRDSQVAGGLWTQDTGRAAGGRGPYGHSTENLSFSKVLLATRRKQQLDRE